MTHRHLIGVVVLIEGSRTFASFLERAVAGRRCRWFARHLEETINRSTRARATKSYRTVSVEVVCKAREMVVAEV